MHAMPPRSPVDPVTVLALVVSVCAFSTSGSPSPVTINFRSSVAAPATSAIAAPP